MEKATTAYEELGRCHECGSVCPESRWMCSDSWSGWQCPICECEDVPIWMDVFEENGLLIYKDRE